MKYHIKAADRCTGDPSGDHAFGAILDLERELPSVILQCFRCGMNHEETPSTPEP